MTKTPKAGADTGLPKTNAPEVRYMKMLTPVESLTENEWQERALEKIALMETVNDCRQELFERNGGRVPIADLDGILWLILTQVSNDADAAVKTITEGFDWGFSRTKTIKKGGRKQ